MERDESKARSRWNMNLHVAGISTMDTLYLRRIRRGKGRTIGNAVSFVFGSLLFMKNPAAGQAIVKGVKLTSTRSIHEE